jgi:hypothetical protein
MRRRLGVSGYGQIVAEDTDEGVLLRAGATFPLEIYSEKRLAEFDRNNERALAGYRLKNCERRCHADAGILKVEILRMSGWNQLPGQRGLATLPGAQKRHHGVSAQGFPDPGQIVLARNHG